MELLKINQFYAKKARKAKKQKKNEITWCPWFILKYLSKHYRGERKGRKMRQEETSTVVYWVLGSDWWLCGEKFNAVCIFGCVHFF